MSKKINHPKPQSKPEPKHGSKGRTISKPPVKPGQTKK